MTENPLTTKSIEKFLTELDVLIRARYPLISINTYEEDRVRQALKDLVFTEMTCTPSPTWVPGVAINPISTGLVGSAMSMM